MTQNQNLITLLEHVTALLSKSLDQILFEKLGIGNSQFRIMLIIRDQPKTNQKFIAQSLGQTEAAISRQIKLLIKGKLILSMRDPLNKRAHLLKLSEKGQRYIQAASVIADRYYFPILEKISQRNQAQLSDLLRQIDKQICNFDHELGYLGYIST